MRLRQERNHFRIAYYQPPQEEMPDPLRGRALAPAGGTPVLPAAGIFLMSRRFSYAMFSCQEAMHTHDSTPQDLSSCRTRWVSAICVAPALITLYVVIVSQEPKGLFLVWPSFCCFAHNHCPRKTFTFDAMQRTVRWKGPQGFSSLNQGNPFDDITDVGQRNRSAGRRGIPVLIASRSSPREPYHPMASLQRTTGPLSAPARADPRLRQARSRCIPPGFEGRSANLK